ncbi:MAG: hypothetical protein WAV90_19185 [Gordonia amarae]
MAKFDSWIEAFVDEHDLDTEHRFDVTGQQWGSNSIPLASVIAKAKACGADEQAEIKRILGEIECHGGDPMHFFEHLAASMAL